VGGDVIGSEALLLAVILSEAPGAESKDRVPGMAGSLEVRVLFPTWWR
jgi:hypothetical protein